MGPAIALRLRQHLTLTPQVQQALRLLQMSALEFAQEMEQALTANPFLEENPEAPCPGSAGAKVPSAGTRGNHHPAGDLRHRVQRPRPAGGRLGRRFHRHAAQPAGAPARAAAHVARRRSRPRAGRDGDRQPRRRRLLQGELRRARRAAAQGARRAARGVRRGAQAGAEPRPGPASARARSRNACASSSRRCRPRRRARDVAIAITNGHLALLANREWARLQHAVGCSEAMLHAARSLIRTLDPRPAHRFGASEARYVIPDVHRAQAARALGGGHQPGVAAAPAPEPRLRRRLRQPQRREPVASRATCRRRAGCCARSSSASPPSSAWPTRSSRASAASSSTARWR